MKYKLTRYHEFKERDSDKSLFEDDEGEWVKWEDAKPLLKPYENLKMDDLGMILSLKDDSQNKNLDEMIGKINDVIGDYGYRISTWGELEKFLELCADMNAYKKELYKKYDLEEYEKEN